MSRINWKLLALKLRNSKLPIEKKWRKFIKLSQFGWKYRHPEDALIMNRWQWKDTTDWLTTHHKMFYDWCRNSGKTEKAFLLAQFQSVIMDNPMVWFAKSTKQFMRVQDLSNRSPFSVFRPASRLRTDIQFITGDRMDIGVLIKMDNASGPHPRGGVYDEFAEMDMDLIQKSYGMYGNDPLILYISTPWAGSPTTIIRDEVETRTHTYLECPWKSRATIEGFRTKGKEDLWAQEYLCKEITRQGCIFTNLIHTTAFPTEFNFITQGLDFGGDYNYMVRLGWANGMRWLLKEKAYRYRKDDEELQKDCLEYPTEGESGGWNKIHAPSLTGISCEDFSTQTGANKKDNLKADRIEELLSTPIGVNRSITPYTIKQMGSTFFENDGRVNTKPLHNVAAMLHAVRKSTVVYAGRSVNTPQQQADLPHFMRVRG